MSLFQFRPDPFRFRPPQIDHRWYWLFQLENWYLLSQTFGYYLEVSSETHARLKALKNGPPSVILVNHTNFADPHVMVELAFLNQLDVHWLAGIEPFDSAWGIFGWHIQRVGSMSVDRGVLDRWSLRRAQQTLENAEAPLVIFPEGEADYSNRVLQPLYPGAAQMALHAQKHHGANTAVQVLPLSISYQFIGNPAKALQKALFRLYRDLVPHPPKNGYPNTLPLWEQALFVLAQGLLSLERQHGLGPASEQSLAHRIETLKSVLAQAIIAEHDPEAREDILSRPRVMDAKNRWRSLIARKRYAPSLEILQSLLKKLDAGEVSLSDLLKLEKTWIGLGFEDLDRDKRLQQLKRHLKQQVPYAQIRAQATAEDLARWATQMEQTRQIKLLALLQDDLCRQDVSWMGIDDVLTKMEILFLGAFRYRKGQRATVCSAPPLDVSAWIDEHSHLSDREKSEALTQQFSQTLGNLMADGQGAFPWRPC